MRQVDAYFLNHEEPVKGCLQFLRAHILKADNQITETWKYGMPVYCYRNKMFCYLWVHKKYHQPYLGIFEGSLMDDADKARPNENIADGPGCRSTYRQNRCYTE